MISFLKNFLSGEKSAEEKILTSQGALPPQKKRDVMTVGDTGSAQDDDDFCAPSGGCCGGGCRS
jgi:hypothetical protein